MTTKPVIFFSPMAYFTQSFLGHRTFSAKTRTVQLEWLITLISQYFPAPKLEETFASQKARIIAQCLVLAQVSKALSENFQCSDMETICPKWQCIPTSWIQSNKGWMPSVRVAEDENSLLGLLLVKTITTISSTSVIR